MRADGRDVGTTDQSGRLVIPDLQPYHATKLGAETHSINIDMAGPTSISGVVAQAGRGTLAKFAARTAGVFIKIAGAVGSLALDGRSIPMTSRGAYVDGLTPGKHYTATTTACTAEIDIPTDVNSLDTVLTTCSPTT